MPHRRMFNEAFRCVAQSHAEPGMPHRRIRRPASCIVAPSHSERGIRPRRMRSQAFQSHATSHAQPGTPQRRMQLEACRTVACAAGNSQPTHAQPGMSQRRIRSEALRTVACGAMTSQALGETFSRCITVLPMGWTWSLAICQQVVESAIDDGGLVQLGVRDAGGAETSSLAGTRCSRSRGSSPSDGPAVAPRLSCGPTSTTKADRKAEGLRTLIRSFLEDPAITGDEGDIALWNDVTS